MAARGWPKGGRWLLALAGVLFLLFGALVAYQKFYAGVRRHSDVNLVAELADAVLVEDEPPITGDWPQWRGPRRDGVAHFPDLLTTWPRGGPARLWRAPAGDGYSAVSVAAGRAYTLYRQGDQEVVVCWQAADGQELWRYPYDNPVQTQYPGPRATPTIDGGRVYTVGAAGALHCLDAANGKKIWMRDLRTELNAAGPQWGHAFSPLVEGNLVLTNPGGRGTALAAFDKMTGDLVWKGQDGTAGYSSPVAFTAAGVRQVAFLTGDGAAAVSPTDGTVYWRYPWQTNFQVNAATPLVFHARSGGRVLDYVFLSSGYGKGCVLLKVESDGGRFEARPVYEGNQLRSHFASPVRYRDHLYGFDESTLACLDVRSGEICWSKSGFQKGSLLLIDHYLLVLGESGKLALLEASPQEPEAMASAQPLRGTCWTMPVLADGRLFLRDLKQVLCLDLRVKK
jgi:outer membrane protein assembly factor BamB